MKRTIQGINEVKEKILSLKGKEVEMNINKGRKKFDTLSGVIKDVYPSVFTVDLLDGTKIKTFSYYDVLCGNVIFLSFD